MNAKSVVTSLVFALTVTACSSKQAVVDEANSGDMQAEENLVLGEDGGADESDLLGEDGGEGLGAEDTMGESVADNMVVNEDGQVAESTPVGVDAPSIPVASTPRAGLWRGSLKSRFEPGMTEWKVGRGESLSLIAGAVFGRTRDWKKLVELNPEITDPNSISVGQVLRLPGSEAVANNEQVEMDPAPSAPTEMPVVSNVDPAPQASEAPPAEVAGTMDIVENAAPPEAPAVPEMADASPAVQEGALNNMVQRVDLSGNKLKLRNILLGVAAFFLLLAGLIFVLSRRKAAKVG